MPGIADQLTAAADRFADGVLAAPDLGARAGTQEWTVRDVAAHVAAGAGAYASMVAGDPTPLDRIARREEIAPALIASLAGAAPPELAELVRDGTGRLAELVRKAGDDELPFYEHRVPAPVLGGLFLSELLVHGDDLGRLPIPPPAAATAVLAVPHVLPFVVTPGRPERTSIAFRARGYGEVMVEVDRDRAWVAEPGGRVDARLSGEPVALLLAAYQRVTPLAPMLRGRLAVTGRRPWRLRALQTRFETA